MTIEHFIRILQASIAPCIFISGLGLLLLSMTNRLPRATDRIRALLSGLKGASDEDSHWMREQIAVLYRRCCLLQTAITLVAVSIFFVSVVMLMLFSTLVLNVDLVSSIKLLFAASLICLIASLLFFLMDIRLTLRSIKIEIGHD